MEENKLAIQNELALEDIKRINETVSRNKERFPENFCFQLTEEEVEKLKMQFTIFNLDQGNNWSQIATSSKNKNSKHRGKKYIPYVFTEQGVAMLSALLTSDVAVIVSVNIMKAFIEMRKFLITNGQLLEHDKKFDLVFDQLQHEENIKQKIFFQGQIYDSYSLIVDIIKMQIRKF